MKDYRFLQQKYIVPTYIDRGLTLVRGEGVYLYDQDGEKYLDMMSGYGACAIGYNNKSLNSAVLAQMEKVHTLHGSFANDTRSLASAKLLELCGSNFSHVYWGNSGTEAVEAAIKFAILATGRKKIVSVIDSYHGKTLGALSATGLTKYRKGFPLLQPFKQVRLNDMVALEAALDNKTAAFIIEPILGDGGLLFPSSKYLKKAREVCTKLGVLLIFDEVQTGVGRTGSFLASKPLGVDADIVCLGKALAAGIACSATVITNDIRSKIPKGAHTSTLGGNPLACAAVLHMLQFLNTKRLNEITSLGDYFLTQLKSIKSKNIKEVRGQGLLIGVEVASGRDKILKEMQESKVLAIPAADNLIRFLPPYIISKKHIDETVAVLNEVLNKE